VKVAKSATLTEQLTYAITEKGFALRWENVEAQAGIK